MNQAPILRIRTFRIVYEFRSTWHFMSEWLLKVDCTYLMVSEGVTAKIASIMPAPSPAEQNKW